MVGPGLCELIPAGLRNLWSIFFEIVLKLLRVYHLQLSDIGFLGVSGALVVLMIYLIAQSLPNRRQWQLRKSDDGGSGGAFDARHYRMDLRQHHRRFRVRKEINLRLGLGWGSNSKLD